LRDRERVSETERLSKDSKYNVRHTAVFNTQYADEALGLPVYTIVRTRDMRETLLNFMVTRHIEKC
jgi:hypothetical protein